MEWSQFFYELYKAYHFDSIYSSITNVSFGVPSKTLIALGCIVLYPIGKTIYNIHFHPLSKYPGPISAKATKIPVALVSWEGSLSQWICHLHEYYRSDVVRISPDELSFIAPSAWKDIYGGRPGHAEFPKDMKAFTGVNSLLTANDAEHSRLRRLLSHGFSDKAIREQEPLIQGYVNNLVSGLKKHIQLSGGKADLVDWFSWTIFDVITDLSFGEPFDCLKNNSYHPWVAMLVDGLKAISLAHVTTRFPPLERLLHLYIPKRMRLAKEDHLKLSKAKVERRLETETTRPDIISYALRRSEDKAGMTREEIHNNMSTLIAAGSETTATALNGAVWFLLSNPHCLEQANEEVRGKFRTAEDITLRAVHSDLTYLHAVIEETFRLYPPALAGQARIAPKGGDTVSGHWVPEGTEVKLNQFAANHSWLNFNSPEAFAPSRWLGNEHFEKDNRDVVQPFSVGMRNCIGKNLAIAEIRLVLTQMLWNFDMELAEETDEEWEKQKAWMVWERKPLIVKLRAREV